MLEFTFLRHSKAAPAANDRDRVLSEDGIQLARERRLKMGNPTFDHVVHSDRIRTKQTACEIADISLSDSTITIVSLFGNEEDARIQAVMGAFGAIGNAPLSQFHLRCKDELDSLARDAVVELLNELPKTHGIGPQGKVLVVGHAVMQQAICLELTQAQEHFLDLALGECQGWRITYAGGPPTVEFIE